MPAPRQLLGIILLAANVALGVAWAADGRRLPDLPAVVDQAPDVPVAQRPLGVMEPWAAAAVRAVDPALPAVVRVGDQQARLQRVGDNAILCPPRTEGCLLIEPGERRVVAAYGPHARTHLLQIAGGRP